MRRLMVAILAAALTYGAAACDSNAGDAPSTSQAGDSLSSWMDAVRDELTDGVEPTTDWQVSVDGSEDQRLGCEDGTARRMFLATVSIPESGEDPDGWMSSLTGALTPLGWDDSTDQPDDPDRGEVARLWSGVRSGDPTGARMDITVQQVDADREKGESGGPIVAYTVLARTKCLPTS